MSSHSSCRTCGRKWTGMKECHCTACHRHFSTVRNFDAHMKRGRCVDPLTLHQRSSSRPLYAIKQSPLGKTFISASVRKKHSFGGAIPSEGSEKNDLTYPIPHPHGASLLDQSATIPLLEGGYD